MSKKKSCRHLPSYWAEAARRFERDIYISTAEVRVTETGLRRLREISATIRSAIDAAAIAFDDAGWAAITIPIEEIGWTSREMIRLGAEVEVVSPAELRETVATIARRTAALYG